MAKVMEETSAGSTRGGGTASGAQPASGNSDWQSLGKRVAFFAQFVVHIFISLNVTTMRHIQSQMGHLFSVFLLSFQTFTFSGIVVTHVAPFLPLSTFPLFTTHTNLPYPHPRVSPLTRVSIPGLPSPRRHHPLAPITNQQPLLPLPPLSSVAHKHKLEAKTWIIMKALPPTKKIAKHAKEMIQQCVFEFISFVANKLFTSSLCLAFLSLFSVVKMTWLEFGCGAQRAIVSC